MPKKTIMSLSENSGRIDIITGPMFSSKTSTLLNRLFNEATVGYRVLYVNHSSDTRSAGPYSTHNPLYKELLSKESGVSFISVEGIEEIIGLVDKYDVIGIDESQFFEDLYEQVLKLAETHNKHVIVAGLSGDFNRKKFGQILSLIPVSDSVVLLHARCLRCVKERKKRDVPAPFTLRLKNDGIRVGGKDKYAALCRKCYVECG